MRKYITKILEKLSELYDIYQRYCWNHEDKNISITITMEENEIIYRLSKQDEVIDEFLMSFNKREEELYTYMCVKLFAKLFDNMQVKKNDNIYINNFYRPHTNVIINDEKIRDLINNMQQNEYKNYIVDSNPTIKKLYKKIPIWNHNKAVITKMGERIKLSKKLTEGLE